MAKDTYIVHPAFTFAQRRGAVMADTTKQYLTGRWVAMNGSGQFAIPGSGRALNNAYGLYWLLEGNQEHIGLTTDFNSGANYVSTNFNTLPSVLASNALTGVYGCFVGACGPAGVDPTLSIVNGSFLTIDAYGRMVIASGSNIVVAVAEVVTTDGGGNVQTLVFKTTGN